MPTVASIKDVLENLSLLDGKPSEREAKTMLILSSVKLTTAANGRKNYSFNLENPTYQDDGFINGWPFL